MGIKEEGRVRVSMGQSVLVVRSVKRLAVNLKIKIDGSSKPNPGKSSCAAVVYIDDELAFSTYRYLGLKTNNIAEHQGLILALRIAVLLKADNVVVESDSRVAVNHFSGAWNANNGDLALLVQRERKLAAKIRYLSVIWVGRANVMPAHNLIEERMNEFQAAGK